MPAHDIVVIGASAGGIDALRTLVKNLPRDLPASIFVVIHFPAFSTSVLPDILSRSGPIHAVQARDRQRIERGKIYVAKPDAHLLVDEGVIRMTRGPLENHTRPSIDPLFRSAAHSYGERVVGVILSGTLFDGTAGLASIKQAGGIAIVEDPREAAFDSMPRSAIANVDIDHVLPIDGIAAKICELACDEEIAPGPRPSPVQVEGGHVSDDSIDPLAESEESRRSVRDDQQQQIAGERDKLPSIYTCPDCSGALWQVNEGAVVRFRCHVGHSYVAEDLLNEQAKNFEKSMWFAIRTLIDKSNLAKQLAQKARTRGHLDSAAQFETNAITAEEHARVLGQLIYVPQANISE